MPVLRFTEEWLDPDLPLGHRPLIGSRLVVQTRPELWGSCSHSILLANSPNRPICGQRPRPRRPVELQRHSNRSTVISKTSTYLRISIAQTLCQQYHIR